MGNLLFNPQGRILKNRFWQGLVVLTVASVILNAAQVMIGASMGAGAIIFFLMGIVLLYSNICVYGKRFHDAGTTAWWILAVWIGSFIISLIMSAVFGGLFLGDEGRAIQEEIAERFAQGDWAVLAQGAERLAELQLPLSIMTTIVTAVVLGFIVGSLATEPRTNKHGPVPGSEYDDFS
ncbi:MAG: DUF805 domain-containing protein [Henriciella sp.]|uniref:DUF805 domain-containing protein n=1 Tax=Henriciella sp. TaxID=1968823 RepID=UPI0032ECE653